MSVRNLAPGNADVIDQSRFSDADRPRNEYIVMKIRWHTKGQRIDDRQIIDLYAVRHGRISVTPLHIDLTHRPTMHDLKAVLGRLFADFAPQRQSPPEGWPSSPHRWGEPASQ